MINYGQGRYDGALGEAHKAVSLDPRHSRAWRELGRAHSGSVGAKTPRRTFRTAVALDPDDWTARNSLGSLFSALNRLDEAISEFERMQALAPDNTRAYNNLGTAFLLQERFDKATEMYERSSVAGQERRPRTPTWARRCTSRACTPTRRALRRRRGPTRRDVPALVQPRRRLLLGARPARAGEGGVRDGPQARRADTSPERPARSVAPGGAGLGLRGAGAPDRGPEQQEHRSRAHKLLALDRTPQLEMRAFSRR